ncbi:PriCT-2 domain-containing protein [Atopomonas sediminilitoris]|uniref:PriCT-2 domain-containing protein n=1 Tax=Atopomonas sediminilitoris TaxID=2919919 RepID=UPI001F4E2338|nr:PriCT-2 domain-containing protein [Atopomonas sediminilitoris]MCJ8168650.1 PriCT-2 domain-containing protein [Atopomonas sediminilitoris]
MVDYPTLMLSDLPLLLRFIPAGDRETWLQVGMGVKAEFGDAAFAEWDSWSASGEGYKAADAKTVWRSFKRGGIGIGTVIKLASDNGWQPDKRELSAEDKHRFAKEQETRRRAREVEVAADEARTARMQAAVAAACQQLWARHVQPTGQSGYLAKKGVPAVGVGFMACTVVLEIDDSAERCQLWAGSEAKRYLDALPKPRPDHLSMMVLRRGDVLIPLRDEAGQVWSVQAINSTGRKLFPKYGRKSGCFHLLGESVGAVPVVGLAEGYATAASCQVASGWSMVMAVDSGNLPAVAAAVRRLCPHARLVVCGDDDPTVKGNPGRVKAEAAAELVGGVAVFPVFKEAA